MYESKHKPLVSAKKFRQRLFFHVLAALVIVMTTLVVGVLGHVYFDDMDLNSAIVAAITLAGGLGLTILPESTAGQLFASLYGILSGYVYIATSSIVLAPIAHRLFHKFHLNSEEEE